MVMPPRFLPPRSSTSARLRSGKPKNTWRRRASPSASTGSTDEHLHPGRSRRHHRQAGGKCRSGRLLHGETARRWRRALRPKIRRGGGGSHDSRHFAERRGADRGSRRRALPPACLAEGARYFPRRRDERTGKTHAPERLCRKSGAREVLMDQAVPPTVILPHQVFTRAEWAHLRADTPLTLTNDDLSRLKSLNDPISLDEVSEIYLPLSRLLSLHVAATQGLHDATRKFLGIEDGVTPFIIGIAG